LCVTAPPCWLVSIGDRRSRRQARSSPCSRRTARRCCCWPKARHGGRRVMRIERPMKSKQVVCLISSHPRKQSRHAHAAALTPALTGGCHGDVPPQIPSRYPTLSILGHHGRRALISPKNKIGKAASLRPPFSTPATPRDKPEPAGPFPVPIECAPPLFVRIPVG
jgi:hypothetical protein